MSLTGPQAGPTLAIMPTETLVTKEIVAEKLSAPPNTWRYAGKIFLVFSFLYLLTSSGRVRTVDEYMAFFETQSMVQRHSTAVPQAVQLNYYYGKYDLRGQPHTPYSPGHPLFAVPWYLLGHYVFERLPGVPGHISQAVLEASVCFSNACFAAAVVAFLFLIFCELGLDLNLAFLTAAMVGLATPVFAYSAWFFSEPLTTALLVAAAYFVFARHKGEPVPIPSAAIGGALLALAVFIRPAHALAAVVFFVALLVRDGIKGLSPALTLSACSAVGLAVLLLYNFHLYGNALEFGYPAAAEGGKRLNSFETPILTGLIGFLFSPGKSIFLFAPPIILAIFGFPKLWRIDRGLALVAGGLLPVYLLFYARYSQWEGGYCVGPRYMVPALALLCIGLAPVTNLSKQMRVAAIALTILGAVVQIISIATSFMESQVPAGVYYRQNWVYKMNYSLWSQVQVLANHIAHPAPARLGLGFDRWFVFLGKLGVSHLTLAVVFCFFAIGFLSSGESLRRALKTTRVQTNSGLQA
jgi:hypothetical protein